MTVKQLRNLIWHLADDAVIRVEEYGSGMEMDIKGIHIGGTRREPCEVLTLQHVPDTGEDS